jgi:hypothetical protein
MRHALFENRNGRSLALEPINDRYQHVAEQRKLGGKQMGGFRHWTSIADVRRQNHGADIPKNPKTYTIVKDATIKRTMQVVTARQRRPIGLVRCHSQYGRLNSREIAGG